MKDLTYSEAEKELDDILESIENEEVDVDELTRKIKRACDLLKLCNAKLKSTDEEVKKILEQFDKETKLNGENSDNQ